MKKRTAGFILASVALAAFPATAADYNYPPRSVGTCAEMSASEARADADAKIGDMQSAVADVLADAEAQTDSAEYRELDTLYARMSSRLLVAEQARENQESTDDPTRLESDCGLVDAAYTAIMADAATADRLVNGGTAGGQGESRTGGENGLPSYDTTTRGRSVAPNGATDGRENSAFGRGTPFS